MGETYPLTGLLALLLPEIAGKFPQIKLSPLPGQGKGGGNLPLVEAKNWFSNPRMFCSVLAPDQFRPLSRRDKSNPIDPQILTFPY